MSYLLQVMPMNKEVKAEEGSNLLNVLNDSNIYVEGTCGGRGTCGKCKVKILNKKLPITDSDKKKLTEVELEEGYRLACKVEINEDLKIEVPVQAKENDRKSCISNLNDINLCTSIKKYYIELPKPVLKDQDGDFERIKRALPEKDVQISINILRKIPKILRDENFKVTVSLYNNKIIDVEQGDTRKKSFGVAFDIGTTTVVGALVNLNNGETIDISSIGNPQRSYGADVISRITYAAEEDGLKILRKKVLEGMNGIIDELCKKNNIKKNNIYHISTVGNTTMHHLFLGVDPTYVARAPYIPAFQREQRLLAKEIGFNVNPDANVFIVPNIAGYVGADTVGVVLDTHLEISDEIKLAIDIGTNGEVLLGSKDKLLACSTAAGPAFEGAQIKFGMRAAEGAIEKVVINEKCEIKTIDDKLPVGICGSGLLDAVAQLVKVGIVDSSGRMLPPEETKNLSKEVQSRIVKGENGFDFILAKKEDSGINEPVLLTQKDVRELQLAKGAIYAGIKVMLKELEIKDEDITEIILAGAFGSYIDRESALGIGLVPEVDIDKINSVGNSAGRGSQMVLISDDEKERSIKIAKNVKYIELSTNQDFQQEYMFAMNFPLK